MRLETLELEKIDYKNKEHLKFLKLLMNSSNINYLWDLSNKELSINTNGNGYIVRNNNKEKIGYLSVSDVTEAIYGKTVSIYYAIEEMYRGKNYGKELVKQVSAYLFNNRDVECIVAQVSKDNIASQIILLKSGYVKIFEDEEDIKFLQTKK